MGSFINFTPAFPPLLFQEELIQYLLKADVATDEGNGRNEMWTLDKDMKLKYHLLNGVKLYNSI